MSTPLSPDVLAQQIRGLEAEAARHERDVRNLWESFEVSASKQGIRIGDLEKEYIRLRNDFKWSMVIAAVIWGAAQGIAMVLLAAWLNAQEANRVAERTREMDAIRAEVQRPIQEFRLYLEQMGLRPDALPKGRRGRDPR